MNSKDNNTKVWKIISDLGVGMLVTQDGSSLSSRPMQIVQDEYDGTLWFYTKVDSEKVEDILVEQSICLSFACPEKSTYVSLSGKASLCRDRDMINKFWNPSVAAWFPRGKDVPSCALIEVKISHGEVWDSDLSSMEYLWEVGMANLTNRTSDKSD